MSIARVFIKNFRLFRELDLDLNKNNLLIIGPNGSGKTSVLEAINLLISKNSSIHHLESGMKNIVIQKKQEIILKISKQLNN